MSHSSRSPPQHHHPLPLVLRNVLEAATATIMVSHRHGCPCHSLWQRSRLFVEPDNHLDDGLGHTPSDHTAVPFCARGGRVIKDISGRVARLFTRSSDDTRLETSCRNVCTRRCVRLLYVLPPSTRARRLFLHDHHLYAVLPIPIQRGSLSSYSISPCSTV